MTRWGERQLGGKHVSAYSSWTPAPAAGIIPLRPLSFGEIFGKTFSALRRNPKVLLLFALGTQLVSSILLGAAMIVLTTIAARRIQNATAVDADAVAIGSGALIAVAVFVLGIAMQCVTVLLQGIVSLEVASGVVAEKRTLRELLRALKPSVWRLILVTLLYTAVTLVAIGVPVLVIALLASTMDGMAAAGGVMLLLLGILGALFVTLWVTTKLAFVTPAITLEHAKVFAALRRSWQLTQGRFWPIFGITFLIGLIFSFISQGVTFVVQLIAMLFGGTVSPLGSSSQDPLSAIVPVAIGAVLTLALSLGISAMSLIVTSTANSILYVDARIRKEGLDIDLLRYMERRDAGDTPLPDPYLYDPSRAAAGAARWNMPVYGQPYPGYGAPMPHPGMPAPYPQAPAQYPPQAAAPYPQMPAQYPTAQQQPAQYPQAQYPQAQYPQVPPVPTSIPPYGAQLPSQQPSVDAPAVANDPAATTTWTAPGSPNGQ